MCALTNDPPSRPREDPGRPVEVAADDEGQRDDGERDEQEADHINCSPRSVSRGRSYRGDETFHESIHRHLSLGPALGR